MVTAVTLYDEDVYAWAYDQAAALRRLAHSRRDLPNDLDLEHLAEEIEDVGRAELHRAESFLRLLLLHLIKIASAPQARSVDHWRAEAKVFQAELVDASTRSIAPKLTLDRRWKLALDQAKAQLELEGDWLAESVPASCPFEVDDLLAEPFELDVLLARLR